MMTPQERRQAAYDRHLNRFQLKSKQAPSQAKARTRTRPPVAPAAPAPASASARRPATLAAPTAPANQPTEPVAALHSVAVTVAPAPAAAPAPAPQQEDVIASSTVHAATQRRAAPLAPAAISRIPAPHAAPLRPTGQRARSGLPRGWWKAKKLEMPRLDTIDEFPLEDDEDDEQLEQLDEPPRKEELTFATMRDMMRRHIETLQSRAEEEEPFDDEDDEEDIDESDDEDDDLDTSEGLDRTRAKIFLAMAKLQQSPLATINDSHEPFDDSEEASQELLLEMRMLRQATSASIDNSSASVLVDHHGLAHADSLERSNVIEAPTDLYSFTSETCGGLTRDQLPPSDLDHDLDDLKEGLGDMKRQLQELRWHLDVHDLDGSFWEAQLQMQKLRHCLTDIILTYTPPSLERHGVVEDRTGLVAGNCARADTAPLPNLDGVIDAQEQPCARLAAMGTESQAATTELQHLSRLDHDNDLDHDLDDLKEELGDMKRQLQELRWHLDVHDLDGSFWEAQLQMQKLRHCLTEITLTYTPPPLQCHGVGQDRTGLVVGTRARADTAPLPNLDKTIDAQEQLPVCAPLAATGTELQAATAEFQPLDQHDQLQSLDQLDYGNPLDNHHDNHHDCNDQLCGSPVPRSSEQRRHDTDETGTPRLGTCLQAVPCHCELGKPSTGWTALAHRRQQLTCKSQAGSTSTRSWWMPVD